LERGRRWPELLRRASPPANPLCPVGADREKRRKEEEEGGGEREARWDPPVSDTELGPATADVDKWRRILRNTSSPLEGAFPDRARPAAAPGT
jgi:hypothetical protein